MADLPPWHHERPWSQLELDDIRRNWAEHPERFSYAAGRWLATLAALPVATAGPDLREYARHKPGCASYMPSDSNCSCGLDAALRGAAAQADGGEAAEKRKPDGWHTYHVCGDVLRELTFVGKDGTVSEAMCPTCGEWYRGTITLPAAARLTDPNP